MYSAMNRHCYVTSCLWDVSPSVNKRWNTVLTRLSEDFYPASSHHQLFNTLLQIRNHRWRKLKEENISDMKLETWSQDLHFKQLYVLHMNDVYACVWVCMCHVTGVESRENFLESVLAFFPGILVLNSDEQACKASTFALLSHIASLTLDYYHIEETLTITIASSPQHPKLQENVV